MDSDHDNWLEDKVSDSFVQLHLIDEVLAAGRTPYQAYQIVRSRNFGKCLVLDGKIQSTDADEFIYHEALVQPAMLAHPAPEKVFIAGGGEGATLREVLRHSTVARAVMVDIDAEVTALCRRHLPERSRGAFEDGRTELHHSDARKFLAESGEDYDVIIIDLPDPVEAGPAYLLFTQEFYRLVAGRLTADGLIAVQAGAAALTELLNLTAVYHTLRSVFPIVAAYATHLPCFGGPWGFCLASHRRDPSLLTAEEVDAAIAGRGLSGLRFYDGITHRGMFSLARYVREALTRQTRLITDAEPLYLYGK
jgi:spermidine synthase